MPSETRLDPLVSESQVGNRLKVLSSLVVIVACLGYLLASGISPAQPAAVHSATRSEIAECHFLLKNSYIDAPGGRTLLLAASKGLQPEMTESELRAAFPSTDDEAACLSTLERLVEQVAASSQQLDTEQVTFRCLKSMVDSLEDPFTRVMTPKEYQAFQESLHSQPYGGVGSELSRSSERLVVVKVLSGAPAAVAGILPGDVLVEVDGVAVGGLTVKEAEALTTGAPGTSVTCVLKREEKATNYRLQRVELTTRSVRSRLVPTPGGEKIGWVSINTFTDSTGQEFEQELSLLRRAGAKGLLLDLRDNMGGYVEAALRVSSVFVESGWPVVKIQSREGTEVKPAVSTNPPEKWPLIIFTNHYTSSASEIVTACLQDYGKAVVVGETTFGKGSVQNTHQFPSGGGLKFTVARYLSPRDRVIDKKGIVPDVELVEQEIPEFCQQQWSQTD